MGAGVAHHPVVEIFSVMGNDVRGKIWKIGSVRTVKAGVRKLNVFRW